MTKSPENAVLAVWRTLGGVHVWNMPPGRRRFPIKNPTNRSLLSIWALSGFTWAFIVGVLSIGFPEWGISPDPRLDGMIYSPIFWASAALWFLYGLGCFYIMARWGADKLTNVFLMAVFTAIVAVYVDPFISAAFFPGFSLGISVEGLLYHMHTSPAEQ